MRILYFLVSIACLFAGVFEAALAIETPACTFHLPRWEIVCASLAFAAGAVVALAFSILLFRKRNTHTGLIPLFTAATCVSFIIFVSFVTIKHLGARAMTAAERVN